MRLFPWFPKSGVSAAACAVCLPKLGCPLCWPLLAGLCSVLGVSFESVNMVLLGLTSLALAVCVAFLVRRRGERCAPLALAAVSLSLLVAFRMFDLGVAADYAGSAGLAVSMAWSVVRSRHRGLVALHPAAARCSLVAPETSSFVPLSRT